MLELLQVLAGLLLVFFLPGYTFVCMLFPRKGELDPEYDIVYRIALGMGLSIVIAIMVGFGLNAISTAEEAYVRKGPLWAIMLSVTAVFWVAGWYRGAYPSAGYLHPKLYRPPPTREIAGVPGSKYSRDSGTEKLVVEREMLMADLARLTSLASTSNPNRKLYYERRAAQTRARIAQVNEVLKRKGKGGK